MSPVAPSSSNKDPNTTKKEPHHHGDDDIENAPLPSANPPATTTRGDSCVSTASSSSVNTTYHKMERRVGEEAAREQAKQKKAAGRSLTVFARHRIRRGKEHLFEAWIKEIAELQRRRYSGFGGAEVVRPTCCDSNEYVSIFRYENYEKLQAFMNSEDRQRMYARTCDFEEQPIELSYHSLEYWFVGEGQGQHDREGRLVDSSSPSTTSPLSIPQPPPKYKMVITTFLLIWLQVHFIGSLVGRIPNIPSLAAEALTVSLVVLGTTYLCMPITTKYLLHWWLFPNPNQRWYCLGERSETAEIKEGMRRLSSGPSSSIDLEEQLPSRKIVDGKHIQHHHSEEDEKEQQHEEEILSV